jgi:hypothetical protein
VLASTKGRIDLRRGFAFDAGIGVLGNNEGTFHGTFTSLE